MNVILCPKIHTFALFMSRATPGQYVINATGNNTKSCRHTKKILATIYISIGAIFSDPSILMH